MAMASGFGLGLMVFYMLLIVGSIAAMVFMVVAFWKAMRAHESIAGSMKEIAEALQVKKEQ